MSTSIMKRLDVWTTLSDAGELSRRLLRLRCVDVETSPLGAGELIRNDCSERIRECERELERIESALAPLYPYSTRKKSFIKQKINIDPDDFVADGRADAARETVDTVLALVERLAAVERERAAAEARERAAAPYKEFDLPLGYGGSDATRTLIGSLPPTVSDDVLDEKLADTPVAYREIGRSPSARYMLFVTVIQNAELLSRRLSSSGFIRADFPPDTGRAEDELGECRAAVARLDNEKDELKNALRENAAHLDDIETLWDSVGTSLNEARLRDKLARTECAVLLRGWVPKKTEEKVKTALDSFECAYDLGDPVEGDDVPVLLENNSFARNFEWVIGMYSYPAYGSFDPTFIMSICYMILFALMFADVGYGLILVLGGFLVPRLLKTDTGLTRTLNMFGWCGIACIVTGVIFGSYFGDLPIAVMKNILHVDAPATLALWFDPIADPLKFLIVSLVAGLIHLITGQAIKFYIICKKSGLFDAVCDIGLYWVLYAGLGLLFIAPAVGKWVALGAALAIVLTGGRHEKNIFMKLGKGLLGLYSLINFGSDILSYARLMALMLAAGILAQVINIIGTMGGNFIGLIFAFLIGHTINFGLNVLGSFVHTGRLQYIEFFGKFYEDGGRPFAPMLPSDRFTRC